MMYEWSSYSISFNLTVPRPFLRRASKIDLTKSRTGSSVCSSSVDQSTFPHGQLTCFFNRSSGWFPLSPLACEVIGKVTDDLHTLQMISMLVRSLTVSEVI